MMHESNVALMQHISYTKRMSVALGGYLKTLRIRRELSKADVIRRIKEQFKIDIDRTTLYRAEEGKAWPKSEYLIALIDILGGRQEDVAWIQQQKEATHQDGERLAQSILTPSTKDAIDAKVDAFARSLTVEQLSQVIALAQSLSDEDLHRWVDIGERMKR